MGRVVPRAWRHSETPGSVAWWDWQDGIRPQYWTDADEAKWRGEPVEKSNPPEAAPVLLPATAEIERPEIEVVSLAEFAAVEEPGAAALVGDADSALVPEGGDVMFYGETAAPVKPRWRLTWRSIWPPVTIG
jgi:hypothetical protein